MCKALISELHRWYCLLHVRVFSSVSDLHKVWKLSANTKQGEKNSATEDLGQLLQRDVHHSVRVK
jgi:hypothetical protein